MESTSAWAPLKKELDKRNWHYVRIENKAGVGVPDVNIHIPRIGDIWVELKYVKQGSKKVGLSREQYNWLTKAHRAGRICYLIARIGKGWLIWNDPVDWERAKSESIPFGLSMAANSPAALLGLLIHYDPRLTRDAVGYYIHG